MSTLHPRRHSEYFPQHGCSWPCFHKLWLTHTPTKSYLTAASLPASSRLSTSLVQVLFNHSCRNCIFLFPIFLMLWHLRLTNQGEMASSRASHSLEIANNALESGPFMCELINPEPLLRITFSISFYIPGGAVPLL